MGSPHMGCPYVGHLTQSRASAQATVLDVDPAHPLEKGDSPPPKKKWPMFIVAKRLDGSR